MSVLSKNDVAAKLADLAGWHHRGNALEKTFDCGSFDGAMLFVNASAAAANAMDHHPDMLVQWNRVTMTLSSHDAGGITERDFSLAKKLDELAPQSSTPEAG